MKTLENCTEALEHSQKFPDAHGLSVNLIFNFDEGATHYREKTEFVKDTGWDQALKKMQAD